MGFFNYFTTVLIISLFWGFMITTILYQMPTADRDIIVKFENAQGISTDYKATTRKFQESLEEQQQFGLVDLGSLALFSGNIIIDLALNSFFAIPQMFSLLFKGIFTLLHINVFLQAQLLLWVQGIFSIIATLVLIRFLLGVRTQSLGAV